MCAYKDVFVCTFNASVALFVLVQDLLPSCHAAFERALEEVSEMSTRNYTLWKFAFVMYALVHPCLVYPRMPRPV